MFPYLPAELQVADAYPASAESASRALAVGFLDCFARYDRNHAVFAWAVLWAVPGQAVLQAELQPVPGFAEPVESARATASAQPIR